MEVIFEVREDEDGGYNACAITDECSIFTQGDTWEELEATSKDAMECSFDGEIPPFRLVLVKDQTL